MPVEIMELIVRAHVQDSPAGGGGAAANDSNSDAAVQKQTLVEECVEQVLEILRHRNER
ncbi:MAG: DUF5908 family protein [Chitinophagaceae bacterium]